MKKVISSLVVSLVMVTGLAVAYPADAQEVSRSVTLTRDSKVGAQAVVKGDYSIKFVEGKDGELVLAKGKKEVVKASYKSTKLAQAATANTVVYMLNSDGSFRVTRIEFKGKSEAISLE